MAATSIGALAALWLAVGTAPERLPLTDTSFVSLASVEEGRTLLTRRDEFIERLSPFDRSARLKTSEPVEEARFLAFAGDQVLPWSPEEARRLTSVVGRLRDALRPYRLPLPATVLLVKTTGLEEGNAGGYTRGNAIVLATNVLGLPDDRLLGLLTHELVHVVSRHDAAFRQKLHAAVGFKPCGEVSLPGTLAHRRITNPDAPRFDRYIEVSHEGHGLRVVPVLFASRDSYDSAKGGQFFEYLVFKLMVVTVDPEGSCTPVLRAGEPILLEPKQVEGFFEKTGRNTEYLLHPEEIAADNFALMVVGRRQPSSPEVVERIRSLVVRAP